MKYTRAFCFCILIWHMLTVPLYAYDKNARFEKISLEDGLSQSVVQNIVQDSTGFLWFGSQDGLNRYDGYNFTTFRRNPSDSTSLSDNFITSLLVDHTGQLWVATNNGLNVSRGARNTFHHYYFDPDDPNSLPGNVVVQLTESREGDLWIRTLPNGLNQWERETGRLIRHAPGDSIQSTLNGPASQDSLGFVWVLGNLATTPTVNRSILYRIDPDDHTVRVYRYAPEETSSLPDTTINFTIVGPSGRLWVATQNRGIFSYDHATDQFVSWNPTNSDVEPLSQYPINNLYESPAGDLWLGTAGGGLYRCRLSDRTYQQFKNEPGNPNSLGHNTIVGILGDRNGVIWIATQAGGLDTYDPRTDTLVRYRNDPNDPTSIGTNQVQVLYHDKSGTIWFGTFGGGLYKFSPVAEKFKRYQADSRDPGSLSENTVWSFHEDESGHVWIGTSGGLNRFNTQKETFKTYTAQPGTPDGLSNNTVRAMETDQFGIFWVATSNGLDKFNQKTGKFTHFRNDPSDPTSLSSNNINSLFKDSRDTLWVGTIFGGLNKFQRSSGTFQRYQAQPNDPTSLSQNVVESIYEDRAGVLWVGTWGGLNKFDRTTGKFKVYLSNPNDPGSLSHNNIQCIYEDKAGNMWLGTWAGLEKFDRETETFQHHTTRDGLPNDVVYGILEDDDGHLWLSTNNGLSRFNPRTGEFRNYFVEDGLQSNEFNSGAFYRMSDGRMLFGGIQGFNIFHPDSIRDNSYIPPIVLTGFKIFEENVRFDQNRTTLDEIVISYRENFIAFEYAALDYNNPSRNQYAYKLENFDNEWHYPGNRRFVSYTNLDGGEYVFHVKGSNSDGVWNEQGIAVKLTVIPPFWKTWWFYVLEVVTAFSLIAGLFIYQQIRHRQQLEFRRKSAELNFAREVQLSMLPKKSIINDNLEIVGKIITATEVGGDYYDFIELPAFRSDSEGAEDETHRYCIAIGDATGHGAAAGLFVGMIKIASTYAIQAMKPQSQLTELVADLNVALKQTHSQRGLGMCFCISVLDIRHSVIELCSAGMPYPYHFHTETQQLRPLIMKGPPLGFLSRIQPQMARVQLSIGDILIFLSDGFEERFNDQDEMWGEEALEQSLQDICRTENRPEFIAQRLINACNDFGGDRANDDDMTIVVVKIK